MRWIKIILISLAVLGIAYTQLIKLMDTRENFVVEKEVQYSIDKVFPQFGNFQNLVRWDYFFSKDKQYSFRFFLPYEGQGSAMSYHNIKDKGEHGEAFIRYVNPHKTIKYDWYKNNEKLPHKITVKFFPKGESTKISWYIEAPITPSLMSLIKKEEKEDVEANIGTSMKNLTNLLSNKVDRETMLSQIKYDSIMIEEQENRLFLGINASANSRKGGLFKNILINHNKVVSYITKDLAKREDEYGEPVLFTDVNGLKNKEISYFYGIPLSKKVGVTDNNFVFRNIRKSKYYSIYYKGNYDQRTKAVGKLLQKIKSDGMIQAGALEELFVEYPSEGKMVLMKLSLPVAVAP